MASVTLPQKVQELAKDGKITVPDIEVIEPLCEGASEADLKSAAEALQKVTVDTKDKVFTTCSIFSGHLQVVDPQRARQDQQIAEESGLLDALREESSRPIQIFGGTGPNQSLLFSPDVGDGGAESMPQHPSPNPTDGLGPYPRRSTDQGLGNINLGQSGASEMVLPQETLTRKGPLSMDVVGRDIRRHYAKIKFAYEAADYANDLKKNEGKIVVAFTILSNGQVTDFSIRDNALGSAILEEKLKAAFTGMRFPQNPFGEKTDVTYPISFALKTD